MDFFGFGALLGKLDRTLARIEKTLSKLTDQLSAFITLVTNIVAADKAKIADLEAKLATALGQLTLLPSPSRKPLPKKLSLMPLLPKLQWTA
jgi:hypothetical protein